MIFMSIEWFLFVHTLAIEYNVNIHERRKNTFLYCKQLLNDIIFNNSNFWIIMLRNVPWYVSNNETDILAREPIKKDDKTKELPISIIFQQERINFRSQFQDVAKHILFFWTKL